jgi:hypothetical protein
MNKIILSATAAALLFPAAARAAAPQKLKGTLVDLNRVVDARAKKMGKVATADATFVDLAKLVAPGALVHVGFIDVGPIQRSAAGSVFIGRHPAAGVFDFAVVTFPADVEISTRASALVIGSFAGSREVVTAAGAKVVLPVIAARLVGVIDGGTFTAGLPTFAPNSPIRIYETGAAKTKPK